MMKFVFLLLVLAAPTVNADSESTRKSEIAELRLIAEALSIDEIITPQIEAWVSALEQHSVAPSVLAVAKKHFAPSAVRDQILASAANGNLLENLQRARRWLQSRHGVQLQEFESDLLDQLREGEISGDGVDPLPEHLEDASELLLLSKFPRRLAQVEVSLVVAAAFLTEQADPLILGRGIHHIRQREFMSASSQLSGSYTEFLTPIVARMIAENPAFEADVVIAGLRGMPARIIGSLGASLMFGTYEVAGRAAKELKDTPRTGVTDPYADQSFDGLYGQAQDIMNRRGLRGSDNQVGRLLLAASQKDPQNADVFTLLGLYASRRGFINSALAPGKIHTFDRELLAKSREFLSAALQLEPKNTDALIYRAYASMQLERFDEAQRDLDRAAAIGSDNTFLLVNQADLLWEQGELDEAVKLYEQAIQPGRGPQKAVVQARSNLAEYRGAIEDQESLTRQAEAQTEDSDNQIELAELFLKSRQNAQVRETLAHISEDSNNWNYQQLMALSYIAEAALLLDEEDQLAQFQDFVAKARKHSEELGHLFFAAHRLLEDASREYEVLVRAGAKINKRYNNGFSFLGMVACNDRPGELKTLLDLGADPNFTDATGETAFNFTIFCRNASAARLMLEHGADPTIPLRDGRKSTELFSRFNPEHKEILEVLTPATE